MIHAVLKHSLKALSRRVTWHCRRLLQECHDDIVEVSIVKSSQTMLVIQALPSIRTFDIGRYFANKRNIYSY